MPRLKPCPRCAGDSLDVGSVASLCLSWVRCEDCGYALQRSVSEDSLPRYWNRLTADTPLEERVVSPRFRPLPVPPESPQLTLLP